MKNANFPYNRLPFLNEQHIGLSISLLMHLGIVLVLLALPVAKTVPPLQTIYLTFQNESGLSAGIPKSAPVNLQEPERIAIPNDHEIIRKQTEDTGQHQSPPIPVEEIDRTMPAAKTTSDASLSTGEDVRMADMPGKSTAENQAAALTQNTWVADPVSEGNSQNKIVESRFGDNGSPSFIYQEIPVYPSLARRLGKEGRVLLKLLIDADGKLLNVEVVEAAGYGFTEASVAAVKKSTYAPGYRNGEKVATRALLPVSFRLQ